MATRTEIRTAVKTLISNQFSTCFDFRPGQLHENELPSALIYFDSGDTSRDYDEKGVTTGRLLIEILISSDGQIDTELDSFASQVEQTIRDSGDLNNLVHQIQRNGFQYERDPESLDATLTLFFNVIYDDED